MSASQQGGSPEFVVAIPARLGSTRLPAKALRLIAGEAMIVHVARRALEAGACEVVVATDDVRIADAVAPLGVAVCMTSANHTSGTDRLAECAELRGWANERIIVNLQGDEPLAPPAAIRAVAQALATSNARIATLAQPLSDTDELFDPNCVKLVRDVNGLALYFSRAPIPWRGTSAFMPIPCLICVRLPRWKRESWSGSSHSSNFVLWKPVGPLQRHSARNPSRQASIPRQI